MNGRVYDPVLARFLSADDKNIVPVSTQHFNRYSYVLNNPLKYTDPTGWKYGDPLREMKIRRNTASNLEGSDVRRNTDGTIRAHQGFDLYAPTGTNIMAVKNGTIVAVSCENTGLYGKSITLKYTDENGNDRYAYYAHLSDINVTVDQDVSEGDALGTTGTTGNANGMTGDDEHLHFEVRTEQNPGGGVNGRENPNTVLDTKFYSQNESANQANTGVIKVDKNGNTIKMNQDGSTETRNADGSITHTSANGTVTTQYAPLIINTQNNNTNTTNTFYNSILSNTQQ